MLLLKIAQLSFWTSVSLKRPPSRRRGAPAGRSRSGSAGAGRGRRRSSTWRARKRRQTACRILKVPFEKSNSRRKPPSFVNHGRTCRSWRRPYGWPRWAHCNVGPCRPKAIRKPEDVSRAFFRAVAPRVLEAAARWCRGSSNSRRFVARVRRSGAKVSFRRTAFEACQRDVGCRPKQPPFF
jgi:hypothetical protein